MQVWFALEGMSIDVLVVRIFFAARTVLICELIHLGIYTYIHTTTNLTCGKKSKKFTLVFLSAWCHTQGAFLDEQTTFGMIPGFLLGVTLLKSLWRAGIPAHTSFRMRVLLCSGTIIILECVIASQSIVFSTTLVHVSACLSGVWYQTNHYILSCTT